MNTSRRSQVRFSVMISPGATPDELLFARQLGAPCVSTWVENDQRHYEYLADLRRRVEDAGLTLFNVGNMDVAKCDQIQLGLPNRDKKIGEFKQFVRDLGRAGIHTTTFTWESSGVWSSDPGESRGATTRTVDMEEMLKRPLTHERAYSEEEIWDNFRYFMKEIIPVAEEAGVRLALHPNDPPVPSLGGIPCLIHNYDCYKKAFAIANSPNLGMEFCVGCWLEGGPAFGDMLTAIRELHADGRIFIVHFRNVSSTLPRFSESFLDNGYMDMAKVMKVFVETGYNNILMLDHTPKFVTPYATGSGVAYAFGYMRALVERAETELGG